MKIQRILGYFIRVVSYFMVMALAYISTGSLLLVLILEVVACIGLKNYLEEEGREQEEKKPRRVIEGVWKVISLPLTMIIGFVFMIMVLAIWQVSVLIIGLWHFILVLLLLFVKTWNARKT